MDQHYARFPEDVFQQPDAALSVDLSNDFVLEAHLQCAAFEMPLSKEDEQYFGPLMLDLLDKTLVKDREGWSVICRLVDELLMKPSQVSHEPEVSTLPEQTCLD